MPSADPSNWYLENAGQRVQIIKKTKDGGSLQFGTEIVNSADGSLSALLGASPGASTAVSIMIEVLKKSCLFKTDKIHLEEKISHLLYDSEFKNETHKKSDNNFLENIKKRNNSILGFHP